MPPANPDSGLPRVRRLALSIEPWRRAQLLAALSYVEGLHWLIDPDMYRIDLTELAALRRMFEREAGPGRDGETPSLVSATYEDLFTLDIIVAAADTYSHRRGGRPVPGLNDGDLDALQEWLADAQRWFRES